MPFTRPQSIHEIKYLFQRDIREKHPSLLYAYRTDEQTRSLFLDPGLKPCLALNIYFGLLLHVNAFACIPHPEALDALRLSPNRYLASIPESMTHIDLERMSIVPVRVANSTPDTSPCHRARPSQYVPYTHKRN